MGIQALEIGIYGSLLGPDNNPNVDGPARATVGSTSGQVSRTIAGIVAGGFGSNFRIYTVEKQRNILVDRSVMRSKPVPLDSHG